MALFQIHRHRVLQIATHDPSARKINIKSVIVAFCRNKYRDASWRKSIPLITWIV